MHTEANISPDIIQTVLSKGWMTHDAMWFLACLQELGIEKTNKLNLAAIELMAQIETKRMLNAIKMSKADLDSFNAVWRFFQGARAMVMPTWMGYHLERAENDTIQWQWHSCFAYNGLKRMGAIEQYRCGVMYRIECWLRALEVPFQLTPAITGCLMHECGECKGEIRFLFNT